MPEEATMLVKRKVRHVRIKRAAIAQREQPSVDQADLHAENAPVRVQAGVQAGAQAMRPGDVLGLQHRAGNRLVGRLLSQGRVQGREAILSRPPMREHAVLTWPLRRARAEMVQRISIPRVATADADWQMVPREHLARVRAAVAILHQKVRSPRLITYFRDNAPGGTLSTLQQVSNRARVWELRTEGSQGMAIEGGNDMAYDTLMYRIGRWQIAATLLHEMGHLASFATEELCERAIDAGNVYAPFIQSVQPRQAAPGEQVTIRGMSFGPRQESTDRVTFGGMDAGRVPTWEWQHAGGGTIQARVPAGATGGPIVVENNRIPSNAVPFRVRGSALSP
jgi:hypothetical protein